MRRAFVLVVLLLTACEGSFVRPENLGRKVEINKSYEARDMCLKRQTFADGTAGVDPAPCWLCFRSPSVIRKGRF
jgi:hypothetical protein